MKKRTNADTKTQRYKDVDMHIRKDAETDSTLEFEFSDSHFRTRTLGLRLSDLDSLIQNLGLELSDSDFRTRTLGLECRTRDSRNQNSWTRNLGLEVFDSIFRIRTLDLKLELSDSHSHTCAFGLGLSNSNSRTWNLAFDIFNSTCPFRVQQSGSA